MTGANEPRLSGLTGLQEDPHPLSPSGGLPRDQPRDPRDQARDQLLDQPRDQEDVI